MKIVVDTNIFVSAIMGARSAPRQVIRLCLQGELQPLMGNALLAEYEDVCSRAGLFDDAVSAPDDRNTLLDAFLSSCLWTPIYYLWRPNLRDEADNHIVELAVAGGAQAIITANVRDFTRPALLFPGLTVVTAGDFLAGRSH
jgi:putative PIN family toxin of toxin-antitoxin system